MPASSCMGFVAQKKCWTRNLQRNAYFIQPYLIKVIRLQDISKSWGHSSLLIKLQQQLQQRRKRQDTAHVTLKLMKVNFLAREVSTTPSMNKKRYHLIYCDCSRWISSASCKKFGFNPVSNAFFIKGSTSLIEFVFFILFRHEQKILAREDRLLACDQKRKSLIGWDFGIQECWEVMRKHLLWKRHLQRKIAYILHFYSTKF